MIYFFFGENTFLMTQEVKKLIEQSNCEVVFFEGKNLNYEQLKRELFQSSIFKKRKLIIIKNLLSCALKSLFLKDIEKISKLSHIILIWEEKEVSKDDIFFKTLKKIAQIKHFPLLEEEDLKNWIKKEFEKYNFKIEKDLPQKLVEFLGNDLWLISNEIKKLVTFKKKEKEVKTEDVINLIKPKIESDIFETIDAIFQKNKKRALALVQKHLQKGDDPLYLFNMIIFQLRNIILVKGLLQNYPYNIALQKSSLPIYLFKKTFSQSAKFNLLQLKKIYHKLFQIDLMIKTGKITPQAGLIFFIADL